MKNNNIFLIYFFLFSLLFIKSNVFAQIKKQQMPISATHIYCANQKAQWKWLTENGKNVEVFGEWMNYEYQVNDNRIISVNFFNIIDGLEKVSELRNKCIANYGAEYIFVQPADSRFFLWYLLGTEDGIAAPGIFYVHSRCVYCLFRHAKRYNHKLTNINYLDLSNLLTTFYKKN